jgi:hypothetical protein
VSVFCGDAAEAVYRLMLEIDRHADLDYHPLRASAAYEAASAGLGWNVDWAKLAEER